ncbi:hypothetical protein V8C40DRAFT_235530 [Trichoderma camerunense]
MPWVRSIGVPGPELGAAVESIASSVCQAYRVEDKQQHFECEIGLPIAAPNPLACMHHAGHCPVKELRLLFTAAADAMMDLRRSHGNRRVADGMVVMATANRREAFKKGVAATASRTYIYLHLHLHLLYVHCASIASLLPSNPLCLARYLAAHTTTILAYTKPRSCTTPSVHYLSIPWHTQPDDTPDLIHSPSIDTIYTYTSITYLTY